MIVNIFALLAVAASVAFASPCGLLPACGVECAIPAVTTGVCGSDLLGAVVSECAPILTSVVAPVVATPVITPACVAIATPVCGAIATPTIGAGLGCCPGGIVTSTVC